MSVFDRDSSTKRQKCEDLNSGKASVKTQVSSLFTIVLDFVSSHIRYVDTFEGFPESIAEIIFKNIVQHNNLMIPGADSLEVTKLFSSAYEDQVLSELCIDSNANLNRVLDRFHGIHFLSKLDLTACDLDDNHAVLKLIGQDFCKISHLSLSQNRITPEGIRIMTTPCRILQRSLSNLKVLNLSHNYHMSSGVLKYTKCLKNLELLDISSSLLAYDPCNLKGFTVITCKPAWYNQEKICETKGWASCLIDNWRKVEGNVLVDKSNKFYKKKPVFGKSHKSLQDRRRTLPYKMLLLSPKKFNSEVNKVHEKKSKSKLEYVDVEDILAGYL